MHLTPYHHALSPGFCFGSSEALERARDVGDLREQFIAVLGHGLRNRLPSIVAGARMLTKEHQEKTSSEILGLMQKT
jgi:hypothetical protein